jgi:hypothetical protein
MRMRASHAVVVVLALCACGPTRVAPTGETGAAYFGLADARENLYLTSAGPIETHEIVRSTEFEEGRFVWDVTARVNGFPVANGERTMRLETTDSELLLLRENDCTPDCEVLSAPVKLLDWPLQEGDAQEAQVDVEVSRGDEVLVDEARTERHATQVGAEEDVTVPAGEFTAFRIAWTRTRTPANGGSAVSENATLRIAPDVGVVVWDGFDAAHLELDEAP